MNAGSWFSTELYRSRAHAASKECIARHTVRAVAIINVMSIATRTANDVELLKLVSGSTTMAIERYPIDANGSQNSRLNCSEAAPMRLAELRSDISTKQWPTHTYTMVVASHKPLDSGL